MLALARAKELLQAGPTGPRFVILVVDGNPDYCNDGDNLCPVDSTVARIQLLKAAGITTLVAGAAQHVELRGRSRHLRGCAAELCQCGRRPARCGGRNRRCRKHRFWHLLRMQHRLCHGAELESRLRRQRQDRPRRARYVLELARQRAVPVAAAHQLCQPNHVVQTTFRAHPQLQLCAVRRQSRASGSARRRREAKRRDRRLRCQ